MHETEKNENCAQFSECARFPRMQLTERIPEALEQRDAAQQQAAGPFCTAMPLAGAPLALPHVFEHRRLVLTWRLGKPSGDYLRVRRREQPGLRCGTCIYTYIHSDIGTSIYIYIYTYT